MHTTYTAQWSANTDTAYKVEYYLENLAGDGYEVQEETFSGVTGSTVTANAKAISGFTYDSNADNVISGTIAGDGSLVLKLYYTRNSYDAKWYDCDGTTLLTTTQAKYQQTISTPEVTAIRDGYTFGGWNIGSVTMTTDGVSFNAMDHGIWTANTYTVVFDGNGGKLYTGDGYEVCLETLRSGDLDGTLRAVTGFGKDKLTLLQTKQGSLDRYSCAWTAAGEAGDTVGRCAILDDGLYHYCLVVTAAAEKAGKLGDTIGQILASFGIAED